ncbi:hypothetical protein R3X26_16450 [Vibrio sp. TH_r3]|uniref:hypothetical protein n=1 Tax=Vibrio sp. TH_r3 TaxID=3082084 RepID=UPI002955798D|nr:hypothetical protein [Vibrio sp. TH_r3]MDV7105999.1 hypothetical protein [Vibrio sp. TH_r3]
MFNLDFLRVSGILFLMLGGAYKLSIINISVAHITLIAFIYISIKTNRLAEFFLFVRKMKTFNIYIVVLFSLLIVSIINFSVLGKGDEGFILWQIKVISSAIISIYMFGYITARVIGKIEIKDAFKYISIFIVMLSIFVLFQLISQDFRLTYLNITAIDGHWKEWASDSPRAVGLKGMSIWDSSLAYSFIFLSLCSIYFNESITFKRITFLSSAFALAILLSFSGRTGIIFSFLFFTLVSFNDRVLFKNYGKMILILLLLVPIVMLSVDEYLLSRLLYAFEFLINIAQGKLETQSTNDLINNHLFIPEIKNLILGDNIFIGDGGSFINSTIKASDSAFVINYAAYGMFGLLGTLLITLMTTLILYRMLLIKRSLFVKVIIFMVLFIISFGLHVKIVAYISPTYLKSLVFCSILIDIFRMRKFYNHPN